MSFVDSWECRHWRVMIQLHQISSEFRVFRHYQGNALMVPTLLVSSQVVFVLPFVHLRCLLFLHFRDYLVESFCFNSFDKEGLWQSHYSFIVLRTVVIVRSSGEWICSVLLSSDMFQLQRELSHEVDSSGHSSVHLLRLSVVL